jgi:hypothetical protein
LSTSTPEPESGVVAITSIVGSATPGVELAGAAAS